MSAVMQGGRDRRDSSDKLMLQHGLVRVAAAAPSLRVADCAYNVERMLGMLQRAENDAVAIVVFPELAITGYTCADLFQQTALQHSAVEHLLRLVRESPFSGLAVVGLPLLKNGQLYNCAAIFQGGSLLGFVPKSFIPNYKEFYELRWFCPANDVCAEQILVGDEMVPFGVDLLFDASSQVPGLVVGVEICEDVWVPIPPSCRQALAGATVLLNLSASNDIIGKAAYRRQLVANQSGRCVAAYLYCSCGVHESTTDIVFGGHCLIGENGSLLTESARFQRDETLLVADIDVQKLTGDRARLNSFGASQSNVAGIDFERIPFTAPPPAEDGSLRRHVEAHPFVPKGQEQLRDRCDEIFHTQVAGLAKRLEHIGKPEVAIGISGGLDSTLALLVVCKTFDLLGVPRSRIRALTMPGFGTSTRTRNNAAALMRHLGVAGREVDIRRLCLDEMHALQHEPFGIKLPAAQEPKAVEELTERLQHLPPEKCHDLVFENVQARMRTSILMNTGFVIGTGDLSELALGWCTYNGDHMSMYNPNVSIPKTLVKFLVRWAAENEFADDARRILLDVVATRISPELLPANQSGQETQSTEGTIGPYELVDFFLYHFLRYGHSPAKILFLAAHATFERPYTGDEIRHWLKVFIKRFFANQFKRSCLPDGPKVGSVSLSPRGDWRMPSDAQASAWQE